MLFSDWFPHPFPDITSEDCLLADDEIGNVGLLSRGVGKISYFRYFTHIFYCVENVVDGIAHIICDPCDIIIFCLQFVFINLDVRVKHMIFDHANVRW